MRPFDYIHLAMMLLIVGLLIYRITSNRSVGVDTIEIYRSTQGATTLLSSKEEFWKQVQATYMESLPARWKLPETGIDRYWREQSEKDMRELVSQSYQIGADFITTANGVTTTTAHCDTMNRF